MVKVSELPEEEERFDLANAPQVVVARALPGEKWFKGEPNKSPGLIIPFETESVKDDDGENMTFRQKYGKMHKVALEDAMAGLTPPLTDTLQLCNYWIEYQMTTFRSGKPRYIPKRVIRPAEPEPAVPAQAYPPAPTRQGRRK